MLCQGKQRETTSGVLKSYQARVLHMNRLKRCAPHAKAALGDWHFCANPLTPQGTSDTSHAHVQLHACLKGFGLQRSKAGSHGAPWARTDLQRMPLQAGQPTGLLCSEEASSNPQQSGSDGPRLMEVELLCLNESLSDSGSPPSIYFNILFMPDALQGQHGAGEEKPAQDISS